jgi:hypothetical protein
MKFRTSARDWEDIRDGPGRAHTRDQRGRQGRDRESPHSVTAQKNNTDIFTAMRTSNLR